MTRLLPGFFLAYLLAAGCPAFAQAPFHPAALGLKFGSKVAAYKAQAKAHQVESTLDEAGFQTLIFAKGDTNLTWNSVTFTGLSANFESDTLFAIVLTKRGTPGLRTEFDRLLQKLGRPESHSETAGQLESVFYSGPFAYVVTGVSYAYLALEDETIDENDPDMDEVLDSPTPVEINASQSPDSLGSLRVKIMTRQRYLSGLMPDIDCAATRLAPRALEGKWTVFKADGDMKDMEQGAQLLFEGDRLSYMPSNRRFTLYYRVQVINGLLRLTGINNRNDIDYCVNMRGDRLTMESEFGGVKYTLTR